MKNLYGENKRLIVRRLPEIDGVSGFVYAVVFLIMMSVVTSFSSNENLRRVYEVVQAAEILLALFGVLLIRKTTGLEKRIIAILLGMAALRLLSVYSGDYVYVVKSIVQIFIIAAMLLLIPKLKINCGFADFYNVLLFLVIVTGFVDFRLSTDKITFTVFGSMNTFAGVFLFLGMLDLMISQVFFRKIYFVNMLLCFVLVWISDSRAPLLTIICFALFFLFLKYVFKHANSKVFFFVLLVLLLTIGIIGYTNVSEWGLYSDLNYISNKLFGKNIDSGRPQIWAEVFRSIENSWLFGIGASRSQMANSGHNQYVQLIGDNGVVGLLLLVFLLYGLWKKIANQGNDNFTCVCLSSFAAIIVYNCFEVALLQNKFALGVIMWFIIGIGLSRNRQVVHLKKRK